MMSGPVEAILSLEREIALMKAALEARPGNITSYELSMELEHREKQRQSLLESLDERQRERLSRARVEVLEVPLGTPRTAFLGWLPAARVVSEDRAVLVVDQVERVYGFEDERLVSISTHPLKRLSRVEVERHLEETRSRLGPAEEILEDVYSDRVRQDSEHRWRQDGVWHIVGIAHYLDSDDYGLYVQRRLER
jgi:hypothetical protein